MKSSVSIRPKLQGIKTLRERGCITFDPILTLCIYIYVSIFFREVAQLKLAEQIIAEKDHDLHSVEYRAEMALVEKEALEEELVAMKSIHNTSNVSFQDTQTSSTPTRVSYK